MDHFIIVMYITDTQNKSNIVRTIINYFKLSFQYRITAILPRNTLDGNCCLILKAHGKLVDCHELVIHGVRLTFATCAYGAIIKSIKSKINWSQVKSFITYLNIIDKRFAAGFAVFYFFNNPDNDMEVYFKNAALLALFRQYIDSDILYYEGVKLQILNVADTLAYQLAQIDRVTNPTNAVIIDTAK